MRQIKVDVGLFSVLDPNEKFHLMCWVPGSLKHITTLVMWGPRRNTSVTRPGSRLLKKIKLEETGGIMIGGEEKGQER